MTKAKVYTLLLKKEDEEKLFSLFHEYAHIAPQYAKWQLRLENCVITCYNSGKTVFQGKDAYIYAAKYDASIVDNQPKEGRKNIYPQAGSDEVGTGDYFGPICVCATYIHPTQVKALESLPIQDSKAITDKLILEVAPILMQQLKHSLLIVSNDKYNEVHVTNNMNQIKAKLHNQAFINLEKKVELPEFIIVDQFTPETSYYRYLQKERKVINHIHFETKAESKYLSVAASSMIARYAFLKEMEKMNEKYQLDFPLGASDKVDLFAIEFINQYGIEELQHVAKMHFKNTEKILND
ncbi:MAG: ribonuclease HIII [Solobacterium sp.]|nr:ribonuclease HIII [Solobacterium sp.]